MDFSKKINLLTLLLSSPALMMPPHISWSSSLVKSFRRPLREVFLTWFLLRTLSKSSEIRFLNQLRIALMEISNSKLSDLSTTSTTTLTLQLSRRRSLPTLPFTTLRSTNGSEILTPTGKEESSTKSDSTEPPMDIKFWESLTLPTSLTKRFFSKDWMEDLSKTSFLIQLPSSHASTIQPPTRLLSSLATHLRRLLREVYQTWLVWLIWSRNSEMRFLKQLRTALTEIRNLRLWD